MYKYTVSRGRDSDISKIACNTIFYLCFKEGLFVAASFCLFRCIVKVETQDFASPERVFINISARFYGGENMLSLLVRRKILRLYRLSPLI